MRVTGYARVSTNEQGQNGASLPAQRSAIEAECERRGWELVEIIEDAGYSARNLNRPGIQAVLKALKAGETEALLVARLDRLSRSTLDFARLVERSQRKGWAIVVLDIGVDLTTPHGRLVAGVLASVAQWERELIGQRTKDAMAARKAEGEVFGPRTWKHRNGVTPEAVAKRIRRERKGGATLQAIADSLNSDGVPTVRGGAQWWPSTIRQVLA